MASTALSAAPKIILSRANLGRIYDRFCLQNQSNSRADLGTPVSIDDQFHEGRTDTDCPRGARMCPVYIMSLRDQKLLRG